MIGFQKRLSEMAAFLCGCVRQAHVLRVEVVCSASCQQFVSESLVGVTASEIRSDYSIH